MRVSDGDVTSAITSKAPPSGIRNQPDKTEVGRELERCRPATPAPAAPP